MLLLWPLLHICLNIDFFFSVEVSTNLFCSRDKALTHIFNIFTVLLEEREGEDVTSLIQSIFFIKIVVKFVYLKKTQFVMIFIFKSEIQVSTFRLSFAF